jgi:hypothetical protein
MENVLNEIKVGESKKIEMSAIEVTEMIDNSPGEYAIKGVYNDHCVVIKLKKNKEVDLVKAVCNDLKYCHETKVEVGNISYLRSIVSSYNKSNDTDIKVRKKDSGFYLYKDVKYVDDTFERCEMLADVKELLGFTHDPKPPKEVVYHDDDEELSPE